MLDRKIQFFFALLLLCLIAPQISLAFFGDKALIKDAFLEVELKSYPSTAAENIIKIGGGEAVKLAVVNAVVFAQMQAFNRFRFQEQAMR